MLPSRMGLRDGDGGLDGSDLTRADLRVFIHLDGLSGTGILHAFSFEKLE